jgi:hypothetical protein
MTNIDNVHKAAETLRETIEKYLGWRAVVYWATSEENEVIGGITISGNLTSQELEHASFFLVGRAHNAVDYSNK